MSNLDFTVETPENYEQKCLCILLLDVSSSMAGKPITELNKGIQSFYEEIKNNSTTANRLEVCLIEFSNTVEVVIEPSLVDNFNMPTLETKGTTKMVDAIRLAISKVEDRKKWYKQTNQKYYRPWIILMSDGEPDNDQDVTGVSKEIQNGVNSKAFNFFAVGVEGANMNKLQQISSKEMPPATLAGLKFIEFFQWLSASLGSITTSKEGDVTDLSVGANNWMKGFKV